MEEPAAFEDPNEADFFINSNVPPPTESKYICSCCNLNLSYQKTLKSFYINSWKVSPWMPLLVNFIILSSYFLSMTMFLPRLNLPPIVDVIITVFMLFFVISYAETILIGPGYLPYYYPMSISPQGHRDYLSGMVTREDQLQYLRGSPDIPRTKYFKSVNRVVIRPDHFCGWTTSFIGKKNNKLFFLFNFWGVIYISCFVSTDLGCLLSMRHIDDHLDVVITGLIYLVLGFFFLMFTTSFTFSSAYHISHNQTQFESMQKSRISKKAAIENWEQVFGTRKEWYLWLLPIPAFRGMEDSDLINAQVGSKML